MELYIVIKEGYDTDADQLWLYDNFNDAEAKYNELKEDKSVIELKLGVYLTHVLYHHNL